MAESFIPIINLGSADCDEKATAEHLVLAFANVGFVYIINHGITNEEINEMFKMSSEFFDLSPELKNKYKHPTRMNKPAFGYVAPQDEVFFHDRPIDIKEAFDCCTDIDDKQWPSDEDCPGFRKKTERFMSQLRELSSRILYLIGLGMGLQDTGRFRDMSEKGCDMQLRYLNYPKISSYSELQTGQLRCSEHTDYGSITLLFQDDCGGLQVLNRHDQYVDAEPMAGAVLVNIADFLAMCSGGKLKSTTHRVLITEKNFMKNRLSIAYFCEPDGDRKVQPLLEAEGDSILAGPAITYNEWRNKRFRETGIIKDTY